MKLTPLGYALIGLVISKPQSGYGLRKVFETTPMGNYSSSPGSIYPALKKLEKARLLEKKPPVSGGKAIYHPTSLGRQEMAVWLQSPVTLEEVANSVDVTLLRFAFLQGVEDQTVTLDFLSSFETAVREHLENLEHYLDSPEGVSLSRHGRLAVENGVRGYKAHLEWIMRAAKEFKSC